MSQLFAVISDLEIWKKVQPQKIPVLLSFISDASAMKASLRVVADFQSFADQRQQHDCVREIALYN